MDDRLSLTVEGIDGRTRRWAGDETDPGDVPTGLSFKTGPSGFESLSCDLLRDSRRGGRERVYDTVKAIGRGGRVAWEGRLSQLPYSQGSDMSQTPDAVGWSAHLLDFPAFREIYVDRDLSRWIAEPTQLQIARMQTYGQVLMTSIGVAPSPQDGLPGITTQLDAQWDGSKLTHCAAYYDAGPGLLVGEIYFDAYQATGGSLGAVAADTNWHLNALSLSDLTLAAGTYEQQANQRPAAAGYWTPGTARRYLELEHYYAAIGAGNVGGVGTSYPAYWRKVAVYGTSGVPLSGSTDPKGVLGSDVIPDILSRAAPLLKYTTGTDGSIEPVGFAIPHLTFLDPTDASSAIAAVNAFYRYETPVWEDRTFYFRPPDPTRRLWRVRRDEGATLQLDGATADSVYNGVIVIYQLPDGTQKIAGPPAANWPGARALCDLTDASLVDTSETNEANRHGIPQRWGVYQVSQITTDSGALQLGAVWLAEHSKPARTGKVTGIGQVRDEQGHVHPAWAPRFGDGLILEDESPDIRRIVETDYSHDAGTITCQLDNSTDDADALLARLGAVDVAVLGG